MAWWVQIVHVELAVTAVAGASFMIAYGLRSPWARSPLGRHLMAFAAIGVLETCILLLLGRGVVLHPAAYVAAYGLGAAVAVQRLWIFIRVQHETSGPPGAAGASSRGKWIMSGVKLFGREPTAWISVLGSILALAIGFGVPGASDGLAAAVTAFLTAGAALWTALRTRPIAPSLVTGFITTAATLIAAFGVDLTQAQVSLISATGLALLGLLVRDQVRPADEVPPESAAALLARPRVDAT